MEGIQLLVAAVSSIGFWISVSSVAVVILSTRQPSIDIDFSPSYVPPGTLAQKSSCLTGLDEECKAASNLAERLACRHKKLVACYASKRIPDATEEKYVTKDGDAQYCIGLVARGTNGPFSNRTVFPVCLKRGESLTFPRGHPYAYVIRPQNAPFTYALQFHGGKQYIMPYKKRTVDDKVEYILPSGNPLPYGLTERIVRLREEYGYDVFPLYERGSDGQLVQTDLSQISFTVSR
jgi:hypothetical protein